MKNIHATLARELRNTIRMMLFHPALYSDYTSCPAHIALSHLVRPARLPRGSNDVNTSPNCLVDCPAIRRLI